MSIEQNRAYAAVMAGVAEGAMRNGPKSGSEEARVAALAAALRAQYDLALAEAAEDFDQMVKDGDAEPLRPSAIARLLRERMRK